MDRDDDGRADRTDWDDVRDEERGMEGGYTSGPDAEALARARRQGGRPSCAPRGYQRSDERIREDIYDRLCGNTGADASEVTVTVHSGEVTLSGTVPDREDEERIARVAENVLGVKGVVSQLRVLAPA
ncbi:MAG: BON domain-containing protein [Pseudomonadota bacterium]|nr:BON domain-containing protein [Pseudomonadota bacterium]